MATAYYELGNRPGLDIAPPTPDHIGAFALHLVGADQEYRKTSAEPLLSSDTTGIATNVALIFSAQFPTDNDLIHAYRQAEPHLGRFLPLLTNAEKAEAVTSEIDGIQADLLLAVPYNEDPQKIIEALTERPDALADHEILSIRNALFAEATDEAQYTSVTANGSVDTTPIQGQEMEIKSPGEIAEEIWRDFSRLGSKPKIPYTQARAMFPNVVREIDKQDDKKRGPAGRMMVKSKQILEYLIAKHSKDTDSNAVRQALETLIKGGRKPPEATGDPRLRNEGGG